MKDFLNSDWLTIEENVEGFANNPPMDKSVVTVGFFCLTVEVKVEKDWLYVEEMESWYVEELRFAKPHMRWVKRVEFMSDTGNWLLENQ